MLDIVIKNGKVVHPDRTIETDVGIRDGKVVLLGKAELMPEAARYVDATGKYVIPGGIDPHTHFEDPPFMGAECRADFFQGTRAAAVGGTTTCIDFAVQGNYGTRLPLDVIGMRLEMARKSAIDYAFHAVVTKNDPETIGQIQEIINMGIPSFKCFMTYEAEGIMADDATILAVMQEMKEHNGIFGAHTENDSIASRNIRQALAAGKGDAIWHALTKPPLVEAEAINRVLFLAKSTGAAFYDFHMSCKEGVEMIASARKQGLPVYAETLTHYLVLTQDVLEGPDGPNYICSPPLRTQDHVDALWQGIVEGNVHTVGSDDNAFDTKQKRMGGPSFESVPNGIPGAEFRIPVVFSEGVSKGRISVNQFVAITSTNAAKILGLYPRKGIIEVGSDADIVLIDPGIEKTIRVADSSLDLDWTPFEGLKVTGWPSMTISRGKVIVEDGQFKGDAGHGEFLKRKLPGDINTRQIV